MLSVLVPQRIIKKIRQNCKAFLREGCYLWGAETEEYPSGSISSTNIFFFELIVMSRLRAGGLSH
jgi:hypothetical protein